MKTWNRFLNGLTVLVALTCMLALMPTRSVGQRLATYTKTALNLGWNDISSTGSVLTPDQGYGQLWYYSTATTSLPFQFVYDGQTFPSGTTLGLMEGAITIGGGYPPEGVNYAGLGSSSYPNELVYWGGYYITSGLSYWWGVDASYYTIYTDVSGSVGSRVFTIQMPYVHTNWGSGGNGDPTQATATSMQIKLYEGSNKIQFIYHDHNYYLGGYYSEGIGLNGGASGGFQFVSSYSGVTSTPATDLQYTPQLPSEFSLQPKTLNYGSVATGSTLTLTTTLRSIGQNTLTVRSSSITGSTDYTILNPIANGTTFASGTSYDFQIQFTPTSTGNRSASFTVVTDAADSATQTVILNGTGLAPTVAYTFLPYNGIQYPYNTLFHHVSLHFGDSLKESFYIQSTGQVPLNINSITFFGLQANMYSIVHMPQNPLPPGVTDSITVRFIPYLEGRPDAQLAISTNAFNQPNDTVQLFGTGKLGHLIVTPQEGRVATGTSNGTLTFDSVAIGDSVCKTIALHNTGTDTVIITKQIVTYGDYDYHFYPLTKPDTILPPDASRLVNVCFVPVAAGDRVASVRFYTNISRTYPDNRDTSQFLVQVNGTGVPYGKLAVSGPATVASIVGTSTCITDTIWNRGSSDLTVNTVKISGPNASDFTLTPPALPAIIAKGGFLTVQLCYKPSERGLSTASLDVAGTTSGLAQNQSLPINGTGQVGCMSAAPNPVPFGSAKYPGITLAKTAGDDTTVTVTNCGDVPMTFRAVAAPASNYTVTPATSGMIAPNGTASFTVHFKADTIGAVNGTLTITPSESSVTPQQLALSGVGGAVMIAASGTPSNTGVGSTSTFPITLVNNGNVSWNPGAPTLTGDYSASGTVGQIAPGGTTTLTVTFTPTASGNRPGSLSFVNQDIAPLAGMPYNFTGVASDAGVPEITAKDGFSIGASYPNPTAKSASVIVTMPHDAKVTVTLVRVDGAPVATVFEGAMSEGQHVITVDAKAIANGTYFYILESENVRLVREMVVTH